MADGTTTPDQVVAASPRWRPRIRLPKPGSNGFLTLCSVVFLFVAWQVLSVVAGRTGVSGERFVPNVVDIAGAFDTFAYYWRGGLGVEATTDGGPVTFFGAVLGLVSNSLATMARLAVGLTLGFVVAGLAATMVCWSRFLRRVFLLPANAARMLPLLAMSPLFGIWFGKSEVGATLFIAFATFAIIFVVALTAIDGVPGYYEQYARSLGARRFRAYITAVLPAALPGLRGGVLLALGFGWSMVIAAEFIGQDLGLGNIVNRAEEFGRTDTLAVLGLFIVLYAWVSYKLTARAFDYLTRWAE
ncbi:MAG: ABC transporter permease subunit [Solirubrobacteraceae bacterium]|nr:ABC transporter permease subunit [Solirubrobacteraceae bacterium]